MSKFLKILVYIFAIIGFILVVGYLAIKSGLTNTKGIVDEQENFFQEQISSSTQAWIDTEEWQVLKEAIEKDVEVINKVSTETGVPSRIIIMPLVVEQLRLFYSQREIFKKVFAPLKILGNQSQFSWGVMGIKQETAIQIEENLKDPKSPWYLGREFENMLDLTTTDHNKERFERLTDEKNRYFSYLYASLFIKELMTQWHNAGFPIDDRPEIIATLYNIGFDNSKPHANPLSGGARIMIGKTAYSFGSLAKSFYDSDELNYFYTTR